MENPTNRLISRVLWYSKPGSNRHGHYWPQDFKSGVSTYSTIRAAVCPMLGRDKSSKIISKCKSLNLYIAESCRNPMAQTTQSPRRV